MLDTYAICRKMLSIIITIKTYSFPRENIIDHPRELLHVFATILSLFSRMTFVEKCNNKYYPFVSNP